jgi:hypothetical protein
VEGTLMIATENNISVGYSNCIYVGHSVAEFSDMLEILELKDPESNLNCLLIRLT